MQKLGKWTSYTRDPATITDPDVRALADRFMWFQNEEGIDWYDFQKTLEPGVYAMRDEDGTLHQIQRDLTKLAPVRGELVRLDIPDTISEESLIESLHGVKMDDEEGIELPVPPPEQISAFDFLQRFTKQERIALRKSNNDDVQDFFDMLRTARQFFIDDPLVSQGLDLIVQQKLITAARKAEILAPV